MKKFIATILIAATAFTGCSTDLDINTDPDLLDPIKAPLSSQLPAGISGLAGGEGAAMAIIGGMWAQYWTQSNASTQYSNIDSYAIKSGDYNYVWDEMYEALGDIRNVKRKALAEGNWNYYLIATTLEAQGSQILTDFYGNIPYEEANNQAILTPKFNTGEEVYDFIIRDLNDALSKDLSQSTGIIPGKDDLIFKGDMAKWTKFANTLKLKVYMRQSNSSRAALAEAGINELLNSGVSFLNEDAAMTQFKDEANQSNPLYEYNNRQLNTATNLRMSKTLSSFLIENGDPRRDKYYTPGNALNQGDFSNPVGATTIAVVDNKATTPIFFMSKEESLFLQAEASERYKNGAGAEALYSEAVTTNFTRYGLDAAPFLSGAYAYPTGTTEEKIEAIITQKWIAGFPGNGAESFFDKNRTGYPKTSPVPQSDSSYIPGQITYSVSGSTGGLFPKRIVYPISETGANINSGAIVPITTPVWWANN